MGVKDFWIFWMCLAQMARCCGDSGDEKGDENGRTRTTPHSLRRHDIFLRSLPRAAPDPCSWKRQDRQRWLRDTHLGVQVEAQHQLLRKAYDAMAERYQDSRSNSHRHQQEELPPFDVEGEGR